MSTDREYRAKVKRFLDAYDKAISHPARDDLDYASEEELAEVARLDEAMVKARAELDADHPRE